MRSGVAAALLSYALAIPVASAQPAVEALKLEPGAVIASDGSIDTATGVTLARARQLWTDPATALLGTWNFAAYIRSTCAWPTRDMGDAFRLPVRNPTPILFVQGDWDTNTPIENLTGILPWFPNAHAILVHRGQHTGPIPLLRDRPDLATAALRFLVDGSLEGLPVEAQLAPVRFAPPSGN
jgi:fermentation-respiration switch protein FrsA (DUF1100 family)